MKFTGKELFELGVPKNKIKFFIDREFTSKEELKAELAPKEVEVQEKVLTWVDWILSKFPVGHLPMGSNGELPVPMSKSELKRIFDSKSIRINRTFPTSKDECVESQFPITDWVWFPNGKRKTTWI